MANPFQIITNLFKTREERGLNLKIPANVAEIFGRTALSSSGVVVTEETAMTFSAVFAAVNTIASNISTLPFKIYKQTGDGKQLADEHDQYWLLKSEPHKDYTSASFFRELIAYYLLWGNGYAHILRHPKTSRPIGYKLLHPRDVVVYRDEEDDEIYYKLTGVPGSVDPIHSSHMIHIKDFCFGEDLGKSRIRTAAESIGMGMAGIRSASSFYRNGMHIPAWVSVPSNLTEEQFEHIRKQLKNNYGGVANAGKVGVFEQGVEFHSIDKYMSFQDAEYIQTMKFSIENVARIFSIPVHKIALMDNATFSNIEHQNKEYVDGCLLPIAVLVEQEFNRKIFRLKEKRTHYVRADFRGLLRADIESRTKHYVSMLQHGVYDIDETRAFEDMNPLPNGIGKKRTVQLNMQPLEDVGKDKQKQNNGEKNIHESE